MIRKIALFAFVCCAFFGGVARSFAQDIAPTSLLYSWPNPTTTGQLGHYVVFSNQNPSGIPWVYSIDWSLSGTAPTVCTFRIEGSWDAINWFGLDTTSPASTSCTTSNMESIAYKPVRYIRVNLPTYTAGDGTTQVIFHYTGGRD